ncbi:MAG: hypothetical protein Q9187_008435, partial [Circinaria calcarea]
IAKAQPKLLILAGRNTSKVEETAKALVSSSPGVATRVLKLDLDSQKQVREAAAEVNAYRENIDVLVNNAGIMAVPYSKTEDGLEKQLAVNHISPFLFTNLIMPKLLAAGPGARIINVGSDGYRLGAIRYFDYNFHDGESYNPWVAYGQTKTANLLFSQALAVKLGSKGLLSFSLHPGVVATNLPTGLTNEDFASLNELDKQIGDPLGWSGFEWLTPNQGVATHVFAAFSPSIVDHNGAYLEKCDVKPLDDIYPWGLGDREARKMWEWSEKLLKQKFEY